MGNLKAYPPSEDSLLLLDAASKLAYGKILEMFCGCGVVSIYLAKFGKCKKVYGVDIDRDSIKLARINAYVNGVFKQTFFFTSDLFSRVPKIKYDTILANPPYLPESSEDRYLNEQERRWIVGGRKGVEISKRFIRESKNYLSSSGRIIIVLSSLGDVADFLEYAEHLGFRATLVKRKRLFFEELLCYMLIPVSSCNTSYQP